VTASLVHTERQDVALQLLVHADGAGAVLVAPPAEQQLTVAGSYCVKATYTEQRHEV
jgi:hypothetical protein